MRTPLIVSRVDELEKISNVLVACSSNYKLESMKKPSRDESQVEIPCAGPVVVNVLHRFHFVEQVRCEVDHGRRIRNAIPSRPLHTLRPNRSLASTHAAK